MKRYAEKPIRLADGITAHPHVHSGAAVIEGRRLSTEWITGQFRAGDSVASIADNYNELPRRIEAAIRYELDRMSRRKPRFYAECKCPARKDR